MYDGDIDDDNDEDHEDDDDAVEDAVKTLLSPVMSGVDHWWLGWQWDVTLGSDAQRWRRMRCRHDAGMTPAMDKEEEDIAR